MRHIGFLIFRIGIVGAAGVLSLGFVFFKYGAYRGTVEAHMQVRASMLAQHEWARSETIFPALAKEGTDYAIVWDTQGRLIYRSPHDPDAYIPRGPTYLYAYSFADGTKTMGVTQKAIGDDGAEYVATYLTTEDRLSWDLYRTVAVVLPGAMVPASVFAVFLGRIKRKLNVPET